MSAETCGEEENSTWILLYDFREVPKSHPSADVGVRGDVYESKEEAKEALRWEEDRPFREVDVSLRRAEKFEE
jgi:hypothetical protein